MLDDLFSNRANDSSDTRDSTHCPTTRELRELRGAASDRARQSSDCWQNGYAQRNDLDFIPPLSCAHCNVSEKLQNVPEDMGYSNRRFRHDRPNDQPWNAARRLDSCKNRTVYITALDAVDKDTGVHRRSSQAKNLYTDGILAGVGGWARETDT